jgi:hypothetical protein
VSRRTNKDGFGLGVLGSCLVMALLLDLGFTVEMRLRKPTQEMTVDVANGPEEAAVVGDADGHDDAASHSRRAPASVPTRTPWHAKHAVRR